MLLHEVSWTLSAQQAAFNGLRIRNCVALVVLIGSRQLDTLINLAVKVLTQRARLDMAKIGLSHTLDGSALQASVERLWNARQPILSVFDLERLGSLCFLGFASLVALARRL